MSRPTLLVVLCLVVSIRSTALAQDQKPPAPPPPPPALEGTGELAYVGTTGNASTSTLGLAAEIIARPDRWLVRNRAAFVRNEAEDLLTAETWRYELRLEHALTPRVSLFGEYGFFRDHFAGIDKRNGAAAGVSWKAIERAPHHLAIDAGLGYLNEDRLTGAAVSSASYAGALTYKWKFSETAEVSDETQVTGTFDNSDDWRLLHALSVTTRMTDLLSLKFTTAARYANFPAPGFRRTDTTTAIALVAKFARPPR